jgi:metal-responsive CopG/Arc/MetJ family transcriptional regulator
MAKTQRGGKREGAGRKTGPEGRAVVVAASIPETLVAQLDELAATKGWNRSKAVTEAVRRLVKAKRKA